jgi:hypothetical protein
LPSLLPREPTRIAQILRVDRAEVVSRAATQQSADDFASQRVTSCDSGGSNAQNSSDPAIAATGVVVIRSSGDDTLWAVVVNNVVGSLCTVRSGSGVLTDRTVSFQMR